MATTQRRPAPTTRPLSAPATRPLVQPTPIDPRERSVQLAELHGHSATSWAARLSGWVLRIDGGLDNAAWWIQSETHAGTRYHVVYAAAQDDALCHCEAAQRGRACWHRGLAILCGRELVRLYSPEGRAEAMRAYWRDVAHEDTRRTLGFSH